MKSLFEVYDVEMINDVLDGANYGVLSMCDGGVPYSVPMNFVRIGNKVYFHGSGNGKKMSLLNKGKSVSFSIVEQYSVIPSYFSSDSGFACKATQFFKSVLINGKIGFVEDYDEKVTVLTEFMNKYQHEGNFKSFDSDIYRSVVERTKIFGINVDNIEAKFKFGQNLDLERFERIIEYLENRGREKDKETVKLMKRLRIENR